MNASVTWHPVAPSAEVRAGANIVAGFAEGQELALWRAADGTPQAWENRCPHRSVRFTLGQVIDDRLACAYHGWQYEAGSGACVRIPAHPAMQAPRNVCAKVYATADAAGMLWVRLAADGPPAPPELAAAVPAGWHLARTLTLRAAASGVRDALDRRGFAPTTETPGAWQGTLDGTPVAALLLDAQPQLSFLHLWAGAVPSSDAMARVHLAARQLRSEIEASSSH